MPNSVTAPRSLPLRQAGLLLLAVFGVFLAAPAFSAGAWETDAQTYSIRLENPKVRVLDARYKAGLKIPSHTLRDRLLVVQKGGRLRTKDSSGLTKEFDLQTGSISWEKAETVELENIGTEEVSVIIVEIKQ